MFANEQSFEIDEDAVAGESQYEGDNGKYEFEEEEEEEQEDDE
jgi:hypothetical protein